MLAHCLLDSKQHVIILDFPVWRQLFQVLQKGHFAAEFKIKLFTIK